MNKNNTLLNWRTVSKLSASFFLGLLVLTACKKEDNTIGGSINPNNLNIITTDTFSIITYSDELDSLESDETAIGLLGAYSDPEFGTVDCGLVTQIRLASENPNFGNVQSVDSVILSFVYAGIKYYNSVDPLTFEVYEITDNLIREDQTYYTFSNVNTTGGNLILPGTETITPKPYNRVVVGSDTIAPQIRLTLNSSFGQFLIDNQSEMSSNDNFTSFFKGLYVKVSGVNLLNNGEGSVLYLSLEDALSKMVIYYTNTSSENKTFSFNINSKTARFNKIDFDRTATNVKLTLDNKSLGMDKFYMQASSIRGVIEFPYILDLYKGRKRIINKAELIVPVQDYQPDGFDPTSSLFIGKIKDKNTSEFTKDYNGFSFVSYDENKKEFRFIMTQELQAVLNGERENTAYRIYPGNFFGSSIERIIFSGANSTAKNKTRLEITYTEY